MKKIGFIGLGIMGKPMARNLMKAGYEVVVFNRSQQKVEELAKEGATGAKSIQEVAESCSTIITMLPDGPDVKQVVLGEEGISSYAKPGTLLIDMSSIAPEISKEIGTVLSQKGIRMLDAPVSGGEPKAVDGTLAIMAGGEEADFEEAAPIFDILGSSKILVGPLGSGNTCKLANQVIVAANIAALSEGMMLAKKAGADPTKVFEAIRGGLAGSTVMNAKMPMILEHNYQPGFKIDLHIKDLKNAQETGEAVSSPMPLTNKVQEMFKLLSSQGEGQLDHSALAKYYEAMTSEMIGR